MLRPSSPPHFWRRCWPFSFVVAASLVLCGCVDQDPAFRRTLSAPVAFEVDGALVAYDSAGRRFAVLRGGATGSVAAAVATSFIDWPHEAPRQGRSGDGKRLLVMDPADRILGAVDPATGKASAWKLPSEFTTLTPGPDGKHAVVWHVNGGAQASSLVNPAEVGLVDLDAPSLEKDNPRVATITGLSRPPIRAQISPEIVAANGKHRVVWVESVSMIGIADFGPSGVRTLVVPLTPPESTVGIVPIKTVTRVDGATLHLYLIASNSNDVVHLSITVGGDKLGTSIDQLASGKGPTDILLFGAGTSLRVATLNATSKELAVLDPSSGAGTFVTLEQAATAFVPYTDADQHPWALMWLGSANSQWLQLVDLERVDKKKGKAIDVLKAELVVRAVVPTKTLFALRHSSGVTGLSLLDPASGKLTSFAGTGLVQDMRVQGDSLFVHGRVGGSSAMSRIELTDLHGSSVNVSPGGDKLLAFGDAGVALTGLGLGSFRVAVFAAGDLKEAPTWLEGIFLNGLFDRKEVTP